jgi:Butirosin biosynthesis protein H, N-terminal
MTTLTPPAVSAPPAVTASRAGLPQAGRQPVPWYRPAINPLAAGVGTVLAAGGHDPLDVLGSGWDFTHVPGQLPFEEFYWPAPPGSDLGSRLAPHHPVTIGWSNDAAGDLSGLIAELSQDRIPIAAVDKFFLPFRPAFHDIHAAHLVLVYGVDQYRGLVWVCDPTPPGFNGPLPFTDFEQARNSANPDDVQDAFFSASEIRGRYLRIVVDPGLTTLSPPELGAAVKANLAGFGAPSPDDGPWTGNNGLSRYLDHVTSHAEAGDADVMRQVYPFAWSAQASAAMHGELLRTRGGQWRIPELTEAGRAVELVASAWTPVRVLAAHGWQAPANIAGPLRSYGRELARHYRIAQELAERAADRLLG